VANASDSELAAGYENVADAHTSASVAMASNPDRPHAHANTHSADAGRIHPTKEA